ncbi:MAG: haloalkane dehalogenase, partial [Actinomycetota bacterium]|nr:haloalkane dehalogenase [Actinomycetota bacterium]
MEAIVTPIEGQNFDEGGRRVFQGFRSPAGEEMVIEKNIFVERVLPSAVIRGLSEEEMTVYREPFLDPQHRRPTLTWPREIPIEGEPQDVVALVEDYAQWLSGSDVPKLFINADPGSI